MPDSATYSVILSGKIKPGFEPDQVAAAFAKLFKLTDEKAGSLVGKKFVIKKEVELQLAKTYKDRLDAIGLEAGLKRHGGIDALALEPGPEPAEAAVPEAPDPEAPNAEPLAVTAGKPTDANSMVCPRCNLEQPGAEECQGCGVIIQKAIAAAAATKQTSDAQSTPPAHTEVVVHADSPAETRPVGIKMFIAPVIAAVLGALLWYFIIVALDYEFGLVAWLIGGVIGFAAVISGARGEATAIACAILVVVSILGGKYLAYASIQADVAESMSTAVEYEGVDLKAFYEEELNDARVFAGLPGDEASLREFLETRGYTDYSAAEIPDEELDMFREFTQPRLETIYLDRPSFDEWRQFTLAGSIEDLSTLDLVIESLGWMDLLFLFFGVATAFRLASQRG